ncbi:MAG: undecaprenyl-phosphate glucose phosphotransferase, partial [Acaryochloridaceae cyanobacterium CSU_3_4]|nr:undecaprenyl-phosphate glucose phosphotransferase [Acaryochloridaceae cyanobacterium CSU_3_4]
MTHNTHGILKANLSTITALQRLLDPALAVVLMFAIAHVSGVYWETSTQLFALTSFLVILPVFKAMGLYRPYRSLAPRLLGLRLLMGWLVVLGILFFIGFATKTSAYFSRILVLTWVVTVPIALFTCHLLIWRLLGYLRSLGHNSKFAVIAGVNSTSLNLANQIWEHRDLGIHLQGFFDHLRPDQLPDVPVIGTLQQLPDYVRAHHIDIVYIATATDGNDDSVTALLEALQDTTACVYFVPSLLLFNLMHGRSYEINGVPLISIWEIPFSDLQYFCKRTIDIVVSG